MVEVGHSSGKCVRWHIIQKSYTETLAPSLSPPPLRRPRLQAHELSLRVVLALPIASMMGLLASTFFSICVSASAPPTLAK